MPSSGPSSASSESDIEDAADLSDYDLSGFGLDEDVPEDSVVTCEAPGCSYAAHRLYEDIPGSLCGHLWGELGVEHVAAKKDAWLCFEHALPCCVANGCLAVIERSSECHFVDARTTRSEGAVIEEEVHEGWNGGPAQLCWRCAQPSKVAHNKARDEAKACSSGEACLSFKKGITLRYIYVCTYQ